MLPLFSSIEFSSAENPLGRRGERLKVKWCCFLFHLELSIHCQNSISGSNESPVKSSSRKEGELEGPFKQTLESQFFCAISEAIDLNLNNKVFFEEISASVKVVDIIEGGKFQSIEQQSHTKILLWAFYRETETTMVLIRLSSAFLWVQFSRWYFWEWDWTDSIWPWVPFF